MNATYLVVSTCGFLLFCLLAFFLIRSEIKCHQLQTAIIGILDTEWMGISELRQELAKRQIGIETDDLIRFMERLKRGGFIDIGPLFVLPEHYKPGQEKYRLTHLPH